MLIAVNDCGGVLFLFRPAAFLFRNASYEERLLAYLFRDYDPVARAVMDVSRSVVVNIDFVLLRIHGLVSDETGN